MIQEKELRFDEEIIPKKRQATYKNIKYGMLVEVLHEGGGYHAGCKVHFFNKKGVLIGNYYEFVPYSKIRLRLPDEYVKDRTYQRFFYGQRFEKIKTALFIPVLNLTGKLLRFTQRILD